MSSINSTRNSQHRRYMLKKKNTHTHTRICEEFNASFYTGRFWHERTKRFHFTLGLKKKRPRRLCGFKNAIGRSLGNLFRWIDVKGHGPVLHYFRVCNWINSRVAISICKSAGSMGGKKRAGTRREKYKYLTPFGEKRRGAFENARAHFERSHVMLDTVLRWRSRLRRAIYFIRRAFFVPGPFTYSLIPALLYRINVPPIYASRLNLSQWISGADRVNRPDIDYSLSAHRRPAWLSAEVYLFICMEISSWPTFEFSAAYRAEPAAAFGVRPEWIGRPSDIGAYLVSNVWNGL